MKKNIKLILLSDCAQNRIPVKVLLSSINPTCILIIIICYDILSPSWRVVMSCQITLPQLSNIHLFAHILGTFTFIFNSCAIFQRKNIKQGFMIDNTKMEQDYQCIQYLTNVSNLRFAYQLSLV